VRKKGRSRFGALLGSVLLVIMLLCLVAPAAFAAAGDEMNAKDLQKVLIAQALPKLELLPITSDSHPFNGAMWQNKPIALAKYGYIEKEYLLSGTANVYDWIANTDFHSRILRSGPYTTRILVNRPKDMSTWSGRVVVEMINSSAMYDWTAIWSALWDQLLPKHDVYVGITAKPAVIPGMLQFDAERYAKLSWPNPQPTDQQAGGLLPDDPGYNPNYSKLYENGLIWDIVTQAGRLLKSAAHGNPLGRPAKLVILSGESQQSGYLATYYKWFTPAAYFNNGKPIYDGYLSECGSAEWGPPLNQNSKLTTPLAADDPQLGTHPARPVPLMALNSQWDYPAARGFASPEDANTKTHKARFWELAGASHGWAWQYLYGDACAADLIKAGFWDPASYDWFTTPSNPEVPLYMAEKAAFEDLMSWIREGVAPPRVARIESKPNDPAIGLGVYRDSAIYDEYGNALGGLRLPMIAAPVASYGEGHYVLTPPYALDEIKPLTPYQLSILYDSKAEYLAKYSAVALKLARQRFLLRSDALKLIATAKDLSNFPIAYSPRQ
jgi:hypothetical protein